MESEFKICVPPWSELTIAPGFLVSTDSDIPNWWWRMWQFLLLGWRWRRIVP